MSNRKKPIMPRNLIAAMIVVATILSVAFYVNYREQEWHNDCDASHDTGLLLTWYMWIHEDKWPSSWADLRGLDTSKLRAWGYRGKASFEELERRVDINFKFRPRLEDPQNAARLRIERWPPWPNNKDLAAANQLTITIECFLDDPMYRFEPVIGAD